MGKRDIGRVVKAVEELEDAIRQTEFFYHVKELAKAYDQVIERFSPLQVGDLAKMIVTPIINEKTAWGWIGSKHFLIEGCVGEIMWVEFRDSKFHFGFKPLQQCWRDKDGNFVNYPPDDLSVFCMNENMLIKVGP